MKITTSNINELPPHLRPIGQMKFTIDGVVYDPVVGAGWFVIRTNGRGQVGGATRNGDSVFFEFADIEQSQSVEGTFGTDRKFHAFYNPRGSLAPREAVSGNYKGLINLEERVVRMDFEFTAKSSNSEQSEITASMKFRFDGPEEKSSERDFRNKK